MKTFGKKLLSMFLAMALVLGMVATMPMSAFAAEAKTKALDLDGYNRITTTDFESLSNERQGKSFKLASGSKTFYVGNYLGKNYLDVDVNFEGDATGAHYLRYMGNPDVSAAIYTSAFTVRMKAVGDVYFVEFGYQDEATKLNTVVPTVEVAAKDYGVDGPSSDFNVKILTDISVSKEDETKEIIAYQFYLNDKFVGEGSFEETAHKRMGLCGQLSAGKTLTVKVPGKKQADPFAGYDRITLADYANSLDNTLKASLGHGASMAYKGTGDLNKSYLDIDVNFNGTTGNGSANLRYQASDRWKDSYNLSWSDGANICLWRYDNNSSTPTLKTVKAADFGINSPSDWFNVKIKTDVTVNAQDATKQTVEVALYLNNKLAYEGTVEETRAAANRDKIFVSAGGAGISARVPMNVEEELKGYTPVTLHDYDGAKTVDGDKFVTSLANGGSINAPFTDFDKTYLDVDVNFNGTKGARGSSNFRYQSSGKWTDNYALGWISDTTLDFFNYRNGSSVVALNANIVAADYGISGPSDWFNVKIATDITVDENNPNQQTVELQLWLNDKLAYIGTHSETRNSTSRAAIFVSVYGALLRLLWKNL